MKIAKIGGLIRVIRDQRVMLDEDLAVLYGVKTKHLNEAVRHNPLRFPEDFMFQLTQDEARLLRSKYSTLETGGQYRDRADFYPPPKRAAGQQGVGRTRV